MIARLTAVAGTLIQCHSRCSSCWCSRIHTAAVIYGECLAACSTYRLQATTNLRCICRLNQGGACLILVLLLVNCRPGVTGMLHSSCFSIPSGITGSRYNNSGILYCTYHLYLQHNSTSSSHTTTNHASSNISCGDCWAY